MATIPASENEFPQILMAEVAAPSTPATGLIVAYAKSDGRMYWKDDAGAEHAVGEGDTAAHLADTTDAHDASAISFDPTGLTEVAATEVQTAIEELDAALAAAAGGPPDCKESAATTDVTMGTPNTWTDSGLSLSLEAGAWLVYATLLIRVTQTGTDQVALRICDNAASTIYATTPLSAVSNNGQELSVHAQRRITLGSTTTVKVQGIAIVRTAVIVADPADAAVADNVTCYMSALKVTAA